MKSNKKKFLKFLLLTTFFLFLPTLVSAGCSILQHCNYGNYVEDKYVEECRTELTENCNCPEPPVCACGTGFNINYNAHGCLATGPTGCGPGLSCCSWQVNGKFPDTDKYNGNKCVVRTTSWGFWCADDGEGVWDASERKCVQCDGGKIEKKICGNTTTLYAGCSQEGNGKCEKACDANVSVKCDDKAEGEACGNGGHCDANCQCVGEVPLPQCSDGIDNDGDGKIDFPADPGCTDANDNDETDVVGACKTGPSYYTCQEKGIKCPTCSEQLIGGLVPCGRMCDDPCTKECECAPCTLCHLFVLFKRIVDFLAKDVLFPLAVLMIIIGGVMFLTAAGDPSRIGTAKRILTSVVIGLLIIFLAWLIVDTIIMFITKSDSPFRNWNEIDCPLPEEAPPSEEKPPSGCTCTDWVNDACGAGGCFPTEMHQTRTCPNDCDKESRCVADVACGAHPPAGCLLNPPNCLLCP